MHPVAIKPNAQTGDDCAIVALQMYTGLPYPHIAAVVAAEAPRAFLRGMWTKEMQRIGKLLGLTLKYRKAFAEDDTGILLLQLEDGCHAVVLFQGVVVNPGDGMVWDYATYLHKSAATPLGLLVEG
jgi:hypothetical protein